MKRSSYRWDTGLRVRVLGLVVFLLSLLVGLGGVLSITFAQLSLLQHRAEHTRENVMLMERATGTFTEMVSALRGYQLTGEDAFFAPYEPSSVRLDQILSRLSREAADDSAQTNRLQLVRELVTTWREKVAEPEIQLKRQGSPEAGRLIATSGLNYIDEIRKVADEFIRWESDRLAREVEVANKAAEQVQLVTWLSVTIAALLALGGFLVFARGVTRSTTALAGAANRIAGGERGVVIDTPLDGELQEVAEAFTTMSLTLAEQEQQLQSQQEELLAQNEELLAQQEALQSHAAEVEQQERRLSRLHNLSGKMIGTIEIELLSHLIVDEYLDLFGGAAGALLLAEEYGDRMLVQAERWLSPDLKGTFIRRSGALARCAERQEVVTAHYPETTTRLSVWQTDLPVAQEVYVPLVHTGRVIGVVIIAFTEAGAVGREARALWEAVAGQAAVALAAAYNHLEVKRAFQSLQEQAAQIEMLNAQLEEERDRAAAQLDIYLSIVTTMRAGAWLCDTGGSLLVVNTTFREFFGDVTEDASAEQMLAQVGNFLPKNDPFPDTVRSLIHSPDAVAEGRIRLANGYTLQWSSAPVGTGQSRVGRLFTFQDVTELAELDRLKSEFVNTVSHELRTPLTSIMGYLGLVLADAAGPLQEQQREFLNVVQRNTTRLTNLINDLLDIQKIESGRTPLQRTQVCLARVVQQVAETFRVQAEQKGLNFVVKAIPGDLPLISADPDKLTQIAANLVSNAVKYTREGRVKVTVQQGRDTVDLVVEDTGIGVPQAEQKRIFEKFYRAEHPYVREVGGTGLGLPIVRTMVEEHGGEIRLESEPGKGSKFTVSFPLLSG
ncbi:MAG: ATP-binding protein [Bacillota bacterium]